MLAIAAQLALYLALRHVAIATMPDWARHRGATAARPWPNLVGARIVPPGGVPAGGTAPTAIGSAPLAPMLVPAPTVPLAVPALIGEPAAPR